MFLCDRKQRQQAAPYFSLLFARTSIDGGSTISVGTFTVVAVATIPGAQAIQDIHW